MPSPPISPTPRRWRSPATDEPHPDYAALLFTFDQPEVTLGDEAAGDGPGNETFGVASDNGRSADFLSAPGSPNRPLPEIRTTSPSPQRPLLSRSSSSSDTVDLSPLPSPPSRARLFNDASNTAGRMLNTVPEEMSQNRSQTDGNTSCEC